MTASAGGVITVYIGGWFEWSGNAYKSYVSLGSLRVAMSDNGTRYYLIADDLGSTSVSLDTNQATTAETRYKAYGEQRTQTGTLPTTVRFTGQRLDDYIKLYWYGSRFCDPALGSCKRMPPADYAPKRDLPRSA